MNMIKLIGYLPWRISLARKLLVKTYELATPVRGPAGGMGPCAAGCPAPGQERPLVGSIRTTPIDFFSVDHSEFSRKKAGGQIATPRYPGPLTIKFIL
jgi:hypothetical protein